MLSGPTADPFSSGAVNQTGTVGFASATCRMANDKLTTEARDALTNVVTDARSSGLAPDAGGDVVEGKPGFGVGEVIGLVVAAVVLVITFGSLIAAGLPLLTALLGIGIGIGLVTAASGFVDMSSTTPMLALMLGSAVAIDYALFIVSRYRNELAAGHEPEEAAGRAVGSAVVFAGLTVVIPLAALSIVGIPFLTQMGLAAAVTVAIAVIIALTLLPALLGFAGHRVLGKKARVTEDGFGTQQRVRPRRAGRHGPARQGRPARPGSAQCGRRRRETPPPTRRETRTRPRLTCWGRRRWGRRPQRSRQAALG
ncbi:MMPL family transporter [Actinophytocola sp.]|uniref:MMPL family transporter n=1 Tax=Actinophytocola sp. TaxID=1872138 RepID=UPI0039C8760E